MKVKSNVWRGVLWSILSSFPFALLTAALFRFPIPFVGYVEGSTAVRLAVPAVLFYGLTGGFIVLGGVGALSGVLANRLGTADQPEIARRMTIVSAVVVSALSVVLLVFLDKLIGPW